MADPKTHLIIIEDDEDLAGLLGSYFRGRGMRVDVTADAQEALDQLKKLKTKPDAIVTDLILPYHLSGLEFIRELKKYDDSIPVILMTAQSSVNVAVEAVQAGAYDFLVKPLHLPQLDISIQRALKMRKLQEENRGLKSSAGDQRFPGMEGVIGRSKEWHQALDLASRVAQSNANVLIHGESGTGKEVISKLIHRWGSRKDAPFVAINCSAIPEGLLESELFGHAKGAFTGAVDKKLGLFEEAEGGTLFLDEIGDLGQGLQAKLLRVLQERSIKRIGENQYRPIDVRIISATHKDLRAECQAGRFREDLYFRLNVIPIVLPPLRDRREDILPLAEYFLKKFSAQSHQDGPQARFSPESLEYLLGHSWPGNVRELENSIERAVVLCSDGEIRASHMTMATGPAAPTPVRVPVLVPTPGPVLEASEASNLTLKEVERRHILRVLEANKGAVGSSARTLGIDRKTLYRKIQQYGLEQDSLQG